MGKDYCLCQGLFNRDLESNILSSKKMQKDFSQKNFLDNCKKESSENFQENNNNIINTNNNNINNEHTYKKSFIFEDMKIKNKEEKKNHIYYKFNGSENIIENGIKEEDNEDEISKENNNNINQIEHSSYKSSKENDSKFSLGNSKNTKSGGINSFKENKNYKSIHDYINKSNNKSTYRNKKEDESISAEHLLNDLQIGDNKEKNINEHISNQNHISKENIYLNYESNYSDNNNFYQNNRNKEANYYSLGDEN